MDTQEYLRSVERDVGRRYMEKISVIDHLDPYAFVQEDLNFEPEAFPAVSSIDIVM